MTIKRLIGTDPDQIPRNSDLGSMAFQDAAGVTVGKLKVNTSATLLGSTAGVAAGVYPLNISDGNTIAAGLQTTDWMVLSAQNTNPGFTGTVAGTGRMVFKGTKAAGTLASPTAPANNDEILSVLGAIWDGSAVQATAQITFKVDGTVSSGVAPQRIEFQTGATNSRTTRLTIGSTGTITAATPIVANDIVTINNNSTSDALRITQTGTGNALVVEDSANPDSTPFVIDTDGRVISGSVSAQGYGGVTPALQVNNTGASTSAIGVSRWVASAVAGQLQLAKSRGSSVGTRSAVIANDDLGSLTWAGDDNTNFVLGASISAQVDGTPGTNDMPGRLVFSTTSDGASSPTERMRIDSAGRVGIGGSAAAGVNLFIRRTLASSEASSTQAILIQPQLSGTLTDYCGIYSQIRLDAAATVTHAYGIYTTGLNLGSGASVTNAYGVAVGNGLVGATNNYGFFSAIAAASNRWNFYASGDAQNYFAGNTGIGGLPSGTYKLEVTGDAYISGNLTVNGTTTTVNSTVVTIDDPVFTLGGDTAPTSDDGKDRGIEFRWHNSFAAKIGFFGFDNSTGKFTFIPDANNTSEVFSGTPGSVAFGGGTFLGNVGVGNITNPTSTLHIGSTSDLTTDTQKIVVQSNGYAGIELNGDVANSSGEPGGAYLKLSQDGGSVIGTVSLSQVSGKDGLGATVTGTLANALVINNEYTAAVQLAVNSNVKLTVASSGKVGINNTAPTGQLHVDGDVIIEASRFDTTTTAISTTTQTEVASYAAATYRTAEFLVQVVDSTNSQYHSAKILVIHNGTTVNLVQYGVVNTASELGTFDADISGGNVRLLFTATAATTKTVKVLATMLTA